jgi:phosphatidylinositol alpha 1,6-mannosyltransferase
VILEAMASGLPVVAPRSGGPVDLVVDGSNGLLFDPRDPDDLLNALGRLVVDPASARQLGDRALSDAQAHSWENILDELLQTLAELVDRHARQPRLPVRKTLPWGFRREQTMRSQNGFAADYRHE